MIDDSKTKKYRRKIAQLKEDASSWRAHWKEISEYTMPRKGRYLTGDDEKSNDGSKKHQKIFNGSPSKALRTIAAGLQGGLTSPSRPWFALTLPDEDLMEYAPVRNWLHMVKGAMENVYSRSNFYGAIHGVYKELAAFGVASMLQEEDFKSIVRFRPFTIGEFWLALDANYRPDGLYRQFSQTARQMVEKFGEENVSRAVRDANGNNNGETRFEVMHCIQKNSERDIQKGDARGMEYESLYFEKNGEQDKFLRESGYKTIPFVSPRWDVTGVDTYGNSPGMDALGDIKMLQKMEEKKLKALDKMVDPPMNAPTAMRAKGGTIIAGGVNYHDTQQGSQGFSPVYQINPNLQNIAFEIDRVEKRVESFFYNDLFLAILNQEKNMTATEVSQRYSEKIQVLGPILERLQAELLDPIIERTYNIMLDLNMLPPIPREMEGMEMKVEYISLLAQAQKMVGTTAIEQTASFVGNLAAVNPDVVDKIDFDEAVDQYGGMLGVPPKIIRTDDKVKEIREQRAQAQQAQMQQAQAIQAAESAKTLSDTKMGEGSALDSLMEGA